MDLIRIARRVSDKTKAKNKPKKVSPKPATPQPDPEIPDVSFDILDPGVEYSFKVDLSLVVDFEGDTKEVSEDRLKKKLKAEMLTAIKGAAAITANDFGLKAANVKVSPMTVSSALNDQMSADEKR